MSNTARVCIPQTAFVPKNVYVHVNGDYLEYLSPKGKKPNEERGFLFYNINQSKFQTILIDELAKSLVMC